MNPINRLLNIQPKVGEKMLFCEEIISETPTASIPVGCLVEIQNGSGDTLSITPFGKSGWHAQVIRGGQRHRRGCMQILGQDVPELESLKAVVDSFLIADYRNFCESDKKSQERRSIFLGIVGMVVLMVAALTFLAFMISIFLRS